MAFASGNHNQFTFHFPKMFIPDYIENKFKPLMNRIVGYPLESALDFLNAAVKSIQLDTSFNQQPITQRDIGTSYDRNTRSHEHPDLLYQKDFSIQFKMDGAHIVYFLLCDLFYHYYLEVKEKYVPDFYIVMLDCFEQEIYRINLHNILFLGIDSIEFDFTNDSIDEKTVTTRWNFEKMNIEMLYEPSKDAQTTPPKPKLN